MKQFHRCILLIITVLMALPLYSQKIPSKFYSEKDLKSFFESQPQFKSQTSDAVLTLTYQNNTYMSYLNGKRFEAFEVELNSAHPTRALLLFPCPGVYSAIIQLDLHNSDPFLTLFPGESEGLISYDMRGYMLSELYGITDGKIHYTNIFLDSKGFTIMASEVEPKPKFFEFIGFNKNKYTWDPIAEKINRLPEEVTFQSNVYKLNKKERTATFMSAKFEINDDLKIPAQISVDDIEFPVDRIGKLAFKNKYVGKLTIPKTIKYISDEAFRYAGIKEIILQSETVKIGNYAFADVKYLKSITIPTTSIPKGAFQGCPDLRSVTFSSANFKEVGEDAFKDCPNLEEIHLQSKTPPTCLGGVRTNNKDNKQLIYYKGFNPVFNNNKTKVNYPIVLFVPQSSKKLYEQTEPWKSFEIDDNYDYDDLPFVSNKFRLGLEFLDFALGQADKAGDIYLNLDLGLRLRYGAWNDRFMVGLGIRYGIGMISPYDKEEVFTGKLFMPIDLQFKFNLLRFAEKEWLFADAKLIFNAIRDKDFQRPMAWAVGVGISFKRWDWNLYLKREFGRYSGRYVDFKEFLPIALGTTIGYYFNLN